MLNDENEVKSISANPNAKLNAWEAVMKFEAAAINSPSANTNLREARGLPLNIWEARKKYQCVAVEISKWLFYVARESSIANERIVAYWNKSKKSMYVLETWRSRFRNGGGMAVKAVYRRLYRMIVAQSVLAVKGYALVRRAVSRLISLYEAGAKKPMRRVAWGQWHEAVIKRNGGLRVGENLAMSINMK
jgi:hypothetical protein